MKTYKNKIVIAWIVMLLVVFNFTYVSAADKQYNPSGTSYVMNEDKYDLNNSSEITYKAEYGAKTIGKATVSGNVESEATFRGYQAYGATGEVSLGYAYSGTYQTDEATNWNLISNDTKTVGDKTMPSKIKKGVIFIEKSVDNYTWTYACEPITNFFGDNKFGKTDVYVAPVEEIKKGMHQSVLLDGVLTNNREKNFEAAAKKLKEEWVDNADSIPSSISKAIKESGIDLDNMTPKKLVEIIQGSDMVLHENIDMNTITLVSRAIHDKANETGVAHMGGYALADYLKTHMGLEYWDRLLGAASSAAVGVI